MESLKRPARTMSWLMVNIGAETNLAFRLLSRLCKLSSQEVCNNPCKPIRMLIVNKGVELIVSKLKP